MRKIYIFYTIIFLSLFLAGCSSSEDGIERCFTGNSLRCIDAIAMTDNSDISDGIGNDTIVMLLNNNLGKEVYNVVLNATDCTDKGVSETVDFISPKETRRFDIPCAGMKPNKKFSTVLEISYYVSPKETSKKQKINGTLTLKVEGLPEAQPSSGVPKKTSIKEEKEEEKPTYKGDMITEPKVIIESEFDNITTQCGYLADVNPEYQITIGIMCMLQNNGKEPLKDLEVCWDINDKCEKIDLNPDESRAVSFKHDEAIFSDELRITIR